MNNTITSKTIGQLTQTENFPDWWKSNKIEIPFFDGKPLTITFMDFEPENDEKFIEEADNALNNFFNLKAVDRIAISDLAYKNCKDFIDAVSYDDVDERLHQIKSKTEIWNFIHPAEILVTRRPYKDQDIYILIACECDWEIEHGLQLVFRQGKKITRISEQDGHLTEADAFDKPDKEDELLSNFDKKKPATNTWQKLLGLIRR